MRKAYKKELKRQMRDQKKRGEEMEGAVRDLVKGDEDVGEVEEEGEEEEEKEEEIEKSLGRLDLKGDEDLDDCGGGGGKGGLDGGRGGVIGGWGWRVRGPGYHGLGEKEG